MFYINPLIKGFFMVFNLITLYRILNFKKMKKLINLFAILFSTLIFAQVSTTRINDFKLGMKKSELEKIIGKSINVKMPDGYQVDAANVVYKGVVYEVYFSNEYDDNGNQLKDMQLSSVKSKDKSLKTLSGIGIGSTLSELIEKYKDNNIEISDSWDYNGNRTKTTRYFNINDYDAGTYLHITLKNGRVTEFYVGYNEGC